MSDGVSIHYEVTGQGSPVLLLAGLAGVGACWGPQIDLFAERHQVIVPDHRGTGASEHTTRDMSIAQHACDMARVIAAVGCGPVHVVGSSTGGAIAFARIDMIVGHDAFDDLPSIATPTLVLVGERDFCAPPYFSAELAQRIPQAEFAVLDGGHFIFLEKPELLHDTVEAFIGKHELV